MDFSFVPSSFVLPLSLGCGAALSAGLLVLMHRTAKVKDPILLAKLGDYESAAYDFTSKPLLTPNEIHFYQRLMEAFAPRHIVLTQVGLGALIDSTLPEGHERRMSQRGRFIGKLVDFVVCDANTLRVQCVIELDDATHDETKDALRDKFLAQVGIPTLRYRSHLKPNVAELRRDVATTLRTT